MVVHRVHHHQDMALGLHKGPHHAEGPHRLPVPHQEPGDDGVIGPFPSGQAVVAPLVQGEVGPPVLEGDAGPGDGHPRAEGGVVALNEGHHVPLWVGGAQIDRSAAGGIPRLGRQRLL